MQGYVLPDDLQLVNVRRGAGTDNALRDQLRIGEVFTVIDGPVCADGYAWFLVVYGGGQLEGWIAEGDDEGYFVGPADGEVDTQAGVERAYLQSNCAVLIEDDFESETSPNDWFFDATDRYEVGIYNGAYNLQINFLRDTGAGDPQGEAAPALWGSLRGVTFADASVEAVITASVFNSSTDSRTGLWLRYQSDTDFLAIMLRGDSSYRVARFSEADGYTDLIGWTRTSTLFTGDGETNTLRVDSEGSRFDLYINGRYVDTFEDEADETSESGRIAFWGASLQTPATFALDYFRVCRR
jgi:hypothetical protein